MHYRFKFHITKHSLTVIAFLSRTSKFIVHDDIVHDDIGQKLLLCNKQMHQLLTCMTAKALKTSARTLSLTRTLTLFFSGELVMTLYSKGRKPSARITARRMGGGR